MGELRELLTGYGYQDVRTLLQSGNVVLESPVSATRLAAQLEREISAEAGFEVPVVVRSRDELARIVAGDPLREIAANRQRYQVTFLSGKPKRAAIEAAAAADIAPERFVHDGREIYSWHPEGIQRSKLIRVLSDEKLGVRGTARNWSTVTRLLEMAGE